MHAIAGVCDGALAAALTVNQLERRGDDAPAQLPAFINFCGPSVNRAPIPLRDLLESTQVRAPSVHILGRADEQLTHDELLSLPGVCQQAVSLWHARGHVVPPATDKLAGAILHAAHAVDIRSGYTPPRSTVVDIPPVVSATSWPQEQGGSESESEPEDAQFDGARTQGLESLLGRGRRAGKGASTDGGRLLSDSLSLLRIGYATELSELERVRAHIQFVCMVIVMVGHSHLLKQARHSDDPSAWSTTTLYAVGKLIDHTANCGFVILLGASTSAPISWRELGWFAATILSLLSVAMFSGVDDAAANWLWSKHEVHVCFADRRRHEIQNLVPLGWSSQDELACLPSLNDARGAFFSALWFLIAFIAWQSARFAACRLGVSKLLLPIAVCYAIFGSQQAFRGKDWPFTLFEEGPLYARALSRNGSQLWWLFALGAHLPPGFPLRLPGEGLRACSGFVFSRRRTRAFWAAANLLIAASTPLIDRALGIGWDASTGKPCGGASWGECGAAATAGFVFTRLAKMALQAVAALGVCAIVPTTLTPITYAGRDSLAILLLNGYVLAIFKVPLTLAFLFARERFGELSAMASLFGMCALLAVGTVNAASTVLRPARNIVVDTMVHARNGRRAKAAVRVLPLACVLVGVLLFIRTTNAPLPPTVAPAVPHRHAYLHEYANLSRAGAKHEAKVHAKEHAKDLKKAHKRAQRASAKAQKKAHMVTEKKVAANVTIVNQSKPAQAKPAL